MASDFGCHHERPSGREGSAVSSQPSFQCQQKQIPRFARNDNTRHRKRAAIAGRPVLKALLQTLLSMSASAVSATATTGGMATTATGGVRSPTTTTSAA